MRRLLASLTWRRVLLASGSLLAVLALASAGRPAPPPGHASEPASARIVLTAADRQATGAAVGISSSASTTGASGASGSRTPTVAPVAWRSAAVRTTRSLAGPVAWPEGGA